MATSNVEVDPGDRGGNGSSQPRGATRDGGLYGGLAGKGPRRRFDKPGRHALCNGHKRRRRRIITAGTWRVDRGPGTTSMRCLPERECDRVQSWESRVDDAQAQQMEYLEKQSSWKEPDFDLVLQYLRTLLLRRTYIALYLVRLLTNVFQTADHSSTPLKTPLPSFPLSSTPPSASPLS